MSASTHAPLTDALADYIAHWAPERMPTALVEMTRTVVYDGTGALIAAANPDYSTGRLIAEFALDQGGREEASLVGTGQRTSCINAALANGTMGYACDVEPHHPEGILHPIAVMVPTALALSERVGATGAQFLAAVALGCEIEYRVSMALGPAQQYHLGFHPSAVCGAFGATAAASYLLGLKHEAVGRALGLAACQASGMMAWESDPTENARPFQMGMAARNGVTAALLAARGFGGPHGVFDHGHTVFNAFSREPRPQRLLADLGRKHDGIMELAIKPYSCVSFLHPGLDALLGLVRDENLSHDAIAKLVLRFPTSGVHCVDANPLKSHCAQYILPVAVVNRGLAVADIFIDRRIGDANVASLARKVEVVADDELEKLFPDFYATIIEVETKDGRRFERRNDVARGYPEVPLASAELDAKFTALAGSVASPERVKKLRAAIFALAGAPTIDEYASLLRAKVGT